MDTKNMIFVFGSNEAGRHGGGAAKYAREKRGAVYGKGLGFQGETYALPTKDWQVETLPLDIINKYVDIFLHNAKQLKELKFQVTCIGCGLAGLKHEDIAPMFKDAPDNCYFDTLWKPYLGEDKKYWGSF